MTDEELTYAKKATRKRQKRGANVAEQEQCKHGKRPPPPKQHKNKPVCAASQQATS